MTAQVLSLDQAARVRFAERVAEREARNAEHKRTKDDRLKAESLRLRNEWLDDLKTWPLAFQKGLCQAVMDATTPAALESRWDDRAASWRRRRECGRDSGLFASSFEEDLLASLHTLRAAARGRRGRPVSGPRDLKRAKVDLLEVLWSWNRRRLDRAELEQLAPAQIEKAREMYERNAAKARRSIEAAEKKLARGRVLAGPRAGKPYSPRTARRFEAQGENAHHELERIEADLRLLEHPDPLRALGIYV